MWNSKAANVTLWVLQVLVAAMFVFAAFPKLTGDPQAVEGFEKLGLGQWFRYFTGGTEVTSAILLLIPATCGVGALLLVCVMIGAIIAHVTVLGGSFAPAAVLLVINAVIAYGRWGRTKALLLG
jgi:putative oxidoreductase